MRSDDLTSEQAQALKSKVGPMLGYLHRLAKRMAKRHFPPDDPLMVAVGQAENAMHALFIEMHYLSCGPVTGRQRREEAEEKNSDQNKEPIASDLG